MVTSLIMMLNDGIAILLAFGAALVLRAILFDKAARFSGVFHDVTSAPLSLVYLSCLFLRTLWLRAVTVCIRLSRWPPELMNCGSLCRHA